MNLETFGGRKLIGALLVVAVAVVITLVKGDVPRELGQLLEVVFGAFVIGNAAEHGAAVLKGKAEVQLASMNKESPATQPPVQQPNIENLEKGVVLIQELLTHIIQKTGLDK